MRARLSPLTQSPLGTIWKDVARRDFERNIDELERKKIVPGPLDYIQGGRPRAKDAHTALPLQLERKLADDFAFISAHDVGAEHVTAAAIERSVDPPGLTVRLAANEGVEDCVREAISDVLQALKECERKTSHRKRCQERILSIVVELNKNRIYSRLRSRHQKKRAPGQSDRLLSLEMIRFVEDRSNTQTRSRPQELLLLQEEMAEFHASVDQLEKSEEPEATEKLKKIVEKAWLMAGGKIGINNRLESVGMLRSELDNSIIRAVDKLANYWRICQDLVKLCLTRQYRELFANTRLEAIQSYAYAPSAGNTRRHSGTKRFVHAEIQVIAYYEVSGSSPLPRIIGASKEACFLCDAFVKAHGVFSVSKAHRQVMNKWTVPDRKEYGAESLKRMQQAVRIVNREVCEEVRSTRRRGGIYPMQSSINLHNAAVMTPTLSTVSSTATVRSKTGSIRELVARLSKSTVKSACIQADEKECKTGSTASTIRPSEEKNGGSAEELAVHQDTESNGACTRAGSTKTMAEESAAALGNGECRGTADAQASEAGRQSPEKGNQADAAGLDSSGVQIASEPTAQDENHKRPSSLGRSSGRSGGRGGRQAVSPGHPAYFRLGKLRVHVYFEEDEDTTSDEDFTRASVSVEPFDERGGIEADAAVKVGKMAEGESSVVVGRRDGAGGGGLRCIRIQLSGRGQDAMLVCRWEGRVGNEEGQAGG